MLTLPLNRELFWEDSIYDVYMMFVWCLLADQCRDIFSITKLEIYWVLNLFEFNIYSICDEKYRRIVCLYVG